jgi:hypothetical protein
LDLLLNSKNADLYRGLPSLDNAPFMRFRAMGSLSDRNIEGHDVSPTTVDFNGDRVDDFIGGAEDGRFYYLKNTISQ